MLVDLGSLEEWPSNQIPGFNEGLLELLPGVAEHSCSLGRRGGFGERLVDGTWLGHVAEHVALELQRETGAHISRGKTRSAGEPGRYNVIYGYWEETVGVEAGKLAVRLVNHLVKPGKEFDFLAELERLIKLAERRAFGPSTQAIIDEAASRDIPWMRLNEGSLIQLGQGKYQQRIRATMTSMTSALAVDIASDKKMTNQLLAAAGLPVPRSEVVRNADDAVAAAGRIGFPVVTKPLDGNHGRGVGLNLADEKSIRVGFERALEQSRDGRVVVETFVKGNDYRMLVVDGHMVAIAERVPAHVLGDGEHTVRELVEITNQDPASRHRTREGADQDHGRREGRGVRARARGSASTRSPPRASGSCSWPPATCPPAASRSTARGRHTRTTSRSPRRPRGSSGSTWPASTSLRRTSPSRSARRAARSSR